VPNLVLLTSLTALTDFISKYWRDRQWLHWQGEHVHRLRWEPRERITAHRTNSLNQLLILHLCTDITYIPAKYQEFLTASHKH